MKTTAIIDLEPYLAELRKLPFVMGAEAELNVRGANRFQADALVRLRTPKGERTFLAEVKRIPLTRPLVDGLLARTPMDIRTKLVLLAPYIGAEVGRHLRENGTNYIDAAGNCFLAIKKDYIANVEGRRPERKTPLERGIRGPGHQVLFAVLARPELLNAPVRILAGAAGVGKTAAAEMVKRLEEEGLVGADRERRRLLRAQTVLDRWLAGYTATVRPQLLMGRFHTNDRGAEVREDRIERELDETATWAWGGGTAAMRLTGYYHGPNTVLHLEHPLPDLGKRLKAIPAGDGPLIVLGVPGSVAFEGAKPRTVHPLLVHAELVATGDERAREAAQEVWNRYLSERT
jgi:hypothetical protein